MASSRSSCFQEGLEADAEILAVFEAVEQGQLVDEDGAEGETLGADEAARRYGAVDVEDARELLVEALDGERARLVEDAAHLDPVVGVGVPTTAGRHQQPIGRGTLLVEGGILVVGIAEDEADG